MLWPSGRAFYAHRNKFRKLQWQLLGSYVIERDQYRISLDWTQLTRDGQLVGSDAARPPIQMLLEADAEGYRSTHEGRRLRWVVKPKEMAEAGLFVRRPRTRFADGTSPVPP